MLLVAAVLVGGLVLWDHYKGTPTDRARELRDKVLRIKPADVTRIELVRSNQTIVVAKTNSHWEVRQPLAVRASDSAVSSLLSEIEFARRERTLTGRDAQEVSLAELGLDNPRLKLRLEGAMPAASILVGNENATKDATYIQVEGNPDVILVRKYTADRFNVSLDDLRDRSVMEFAANDASRLEIKSADRVIELVKSKNVADGSGIWSIRQPYMARADQSVVNGLLSELNAVRVSDFVSEDPKDVHTYHLDDPVREVTVWLDSGDTGKTLLIGPSPTNDTGKVYAKRKTSDSIVTLPASVAQKFEIQVADVRERKMLDFQTESVHQVELQRAGSSFAIQRSGETWRVVISPTVTMPADAATVRELLRQLGSVRASQFTADVVTDLDKYGLAAPAITVTLRGAATNDMGQLLVGSLDASNNVYFVKRNDEPFVCAVETNVIGWLPAKPIELRSRQLAEFTADDITKLTIKQAGKQTVLERGAEGKWALVEPAQGAFDNDNLQLFLGSLANIRVNEYMSEGLAGLEKFGLDAPQTVITFQAGTKTYTLSLGRLEGTDQRYACWNDPELVFRLWEPTAATLLREIVSPPPAPAPAP
jgi:hypothetical protein